MAESLKQELYVGRLQPGIRLRERADLSGGNRQGATPKEEILQPRAHLPNSALHDVVDSERQLALVGQEGAIMVLQVLAHACEMVHDRNTVLGQLRGGADAGQQ